MSLRVLITGGRGMVDATSLTPSERTGSSRRLPWRNSISRMRRRPFATWADFGARRHHPRGGRVGGIQANMKAPVAFLVENVDIGRNVIMAASKLVWPRVLNLASSCIYPLDRDDALREDDILTGPLEPTNEGYAIAKIFALRLCEYLNRGRDEIRFKTMIPCNLYGRYDHFERASRTSCHRSSERFTKPRGHGARRSRFGATAPHAASSCMRGTSPRPSCRPSNVLTPCRPHERRPRPRSLGASVL